MAVDGENMKSESIKISDEWMEQLKQLPYTSSKKIKINYLFSNYYVYRKEWKDPVLAQIERQVFRGTEKKKEDRTFGNLWSI